MTVPEYFWIFPILLIHVDRVDVCHVDCVLRNVEAGNLDWSTELSWQGKNENIAESPDLVHDSLSVVHLVSVHHTNHAVASSHNPEHRKCN